MKLKFEEHSDSWTEAREPLADGKSEKINEGLNSNRDSGKRKILKF